VLIRCRTVRDNRHVVVQGEDGADGEIRTRDVGKPAEVAAGVPLLTLDNQKIDPLFSHPFTYGLPPPFELVRGERIRAPVCPG
jgi:hypothetical protein